MRRELTVLFGIGDITLLCACFLVVRSHIKINQRLITPSVSINSDMDHMCSSVIFTYRVLQFFYVLRFPRKPITPESLVCSSIPYLILQIFNTNKKFVISISKHSVHVDHPARRTFSKVKAIRD